MNTPKCSVCGAAMLRDFLGCYWICDRHPAPADLPRGFEWAMPTLSDETLSKRELT